MFKSSANNLVRKTKRNLFCIVCCCRCIYSKRFITYKNLIILKGTIAIDSTVGSAT